MYLQQQQELEKRVIKNMTSKKEKKMAKLIKNKTAAKVEEPIKKQSATDFVMKYLCDNRDATEEEAQKALEKKGFKRLAETTIYYWVKDMKKIMDYLKETGKIIA